jgi:superfamily II DNA or RNA helicase
VLTDDDPAVDYDAARKADYVRLPEFKRKLRGPDDDKLFDERVSQAPALPQREDDAETIFDPTGVNVPAPARRQIKSEVGARAVTEVEEWFQRNWEVSRDYKDELIDLLNKSKFGQHEYTPYQIYLKALYEYLKDQLDASDGMLFGRSAVDLAEFQDDAVKRARRILQRYDGVLIADSVGLGKTWIGKKLLEDYAYHQRLKALVVCPASLRDMWRRELTESTISAQVLGMEEMGREGFDPLPYADADVILIDEAHNFRSDKANRYVSLDDVIQRKGGRGRDGQRKKVILLTATPINNDLYDLLSQIKLFTQNQPDYFREAGIGDLNSYFKAARSAARRNGASPGELLFNLLDEFVVRNTRPYIKAAYPNATIKGEPVSFPERELKTIRYDLDAVYSGLYEHVVHEIEALSLAPYKLETYKKRDEEKDEWESGRQEGLVGIFKTRFLKRLESSVEAFRLSVYRALIFEQVYLDLLNAGRVIASKDFWKMLRIAGLDGEDDLAADNLADTLGDQVEVREYLDSLPKVELKSYDVKRLKADVQADIDLLNNLHIKIKPLVAQDAKLAALKELLAGELKRKKVLIFSSYKDTTRYVHRELTDAKGFLNAAGNPHVRRIDSGNHPDERTGIVASFAPEAMSHVTPTDEREIDVLISTDVLSEGQNLQDCGIMINYDLTWNPIRLVQRAGRIDRLRSRHKSIEIWNMFPEDELETLLGLVQRLSTRITQIDELGMLDASVLGELVHPRTFNTIRRVKDGDESVLDEEEMRAELGGPEVLLKQLKDMLNKEGSREAVNLPDGIHSGLRRQNVHGMFFYFKAPRADGDGFRHYWRYVDANSAKVTDNRFQISQLIAYRADEPRYIGDQDVFKLQEVVINDILSSERIVVAKATLATTPDPIQLALAEDVKSVLRRGEDGINRDDGKTALQFLAEPAGKALAVKLKEARRIWQTSSDATALIQRLLQLASEYGKADANLSDGPTLSKDDLQLVCFEYISAG